MIKGADAKGKVVVVGFELDPVPDLEPDLEPDSEPDSGVVEDSAASVLSNSGIAVKVPTTEVRVVMPDWSVL